MLSPPARPARRRRARLGHRPLGRRRQRHPVDGPASAAPCGCSTRHLGRRRAASSRSWSTSRRAVCRDRRRGATPGVCPRSSTSAAPRRLAHGDAVTGPGLVRRAHRRSRLGGEDFAWYLTEVPGRDGPARDPYAGRSDLRPAPRRPRHRRARDRRSGPGYWPGPCSTPDASDGADHRRRGSDSVTFRRPLSTSGRAGRPTCSIFSSRSDGPSYRAVSSPAPRKGARLRQATKVAAAVGRRLLGLGRRAAAARQQRRRHRRLGGGDVRRHRRRGPQGRHGLRRGWPWRPVVQRRRRGRPRQGQDRARRPRPRRPRRPTARPSPPARSACSSSSTPATTNDHRGRLRLRQGRRRRPPRPVPRTSSSPSSTTRRPTRRARTSTRSPSPRSRAPSSSAPPRP